MTKKSPPFSLSCVGIILTAIILLLFITYALFNVAAIKNLKPNEFGDFFAGLAGPLTIIWLVIGYFQQGKELQNSVAALSLQAEELRKSSEAQHTLATVSKVQSDLEIARFHEEKRVARARTRPRIKLTNRHSERFGDSDGKPISPHIPGALVYAIHQFTFKNTGHECHDVAIEYLFDNEELNETRYELKFPENSQVFHHIQQEKSKSFKKCEIKLSYTSAIDEKLNLQFIIVFCEETGRYVRNV